MALGRSVASPLVLLLAATLGASVALAEPPMRAAPEVEGLARGLICAPPSGGRRDAPDTVAGWIHVPDLHVEILVEGSTAPALLHTGFGVRYRLAGTAFRRVRYQVEHPPMPPAGITRQSWESLVAPGIDEQVFFQFDLPEELLPGDWSFAAFDGDRELFHAGFQVVDPARVPELAALCRGVNMLSVSPSDPDAAG